MSRSLTARALLLALASLLLPLLQAGPASAGITRSSLPSLDRVASVYPSLAGGTVETERSRVLEAPGRTCNATTKVRARSLTRSYLPDYSETGFHVRGPVVMIQASQLRSVAQAKAHMRSFENFATRCKKSRDDGVTTRVTKLKVGRIGQQRVAMTLTFSFDGSKATTRYIVARTKKVVTATQVMTFTGAPSTAKAVTMARIAHRRAR